MATVYKTFTASDVNDRTTTSLSSSQKTAVNTTLSNFITYFKAKHLS